MAPRPAVPLREIVYTLSPYNQEIVMQGVAKLPGKIAKFFKNVSRLVRVSQWAPQGPLQTSCVTPVCRCLLLLSCRTPPA